MKLSSKDISEIKTQAPWRAEGRKGGVTGHAGHPRHSLRTQCPDNQDRGTSPALADGWGEKFSVSWFTASRRQQGRAGACSRGENVVAVYVAPEKEGAKADPLKEAALAAGLKVLQPDSYKKPDVLAEFKALKPDLQVMAFVTLFVPEEFLNAPTHGSIQYHPSLLPAYRGASAINWPIIKGEKETGLSIFWPDNGLDTGDVLVQKKTPISNTDTLGTIYFDRLFPMGVEAMLESVDLVKVGKAPRIKQDESKATYEGRCGPGNAKIDWGKPWEQIDRLIRGCNPAPGA